MKRIEVKLSLSAVAPLLDIIKTAAGSLAWSLAVALPDFARDGEWRDVWARPLLESQNTGLAQLLGLFDSDFFKTGVIAFDEENATSLLRACAAVRLQVRAQFLTALPDAVMETGAVDPVTLDDGTRKALMCHLFLATMQEVIIRHLGNSILEG
ncbi:MAG: hypothetical protein LBI02_03710 [Opitutaceae bacterium]|jgi:hypothetical protein|nr:hypothetical protein [Opitutaceae bacterium]